MGDVFLGLSADSRATIEAYFQWGKIRREKFDRDLEFETRTFADSNIHDTTYSRDEVRNYLNAHLKQLNESMEKEAHYQALAAAQLMRAVFLEADKHRVSVSINSAEVLANMGGTSAMERAEARLIGGAPKGRLQPLGGLDTGNETAKQLAAAHEEIRQLNDKLRKAQDQLHMAMDSRANMHQENTLMQQQLNDTTMSAELQAQVSLQIQQDVNAQTQGLNHELQVARSEIAQLTQQMADRLAASPQFQNLQQMLQQKNQQVKGLREALMRYDPATAAQLSGVQAEVDEDED